MHSAHPKWWLWKFWWQIWWLCNSAYNIRNISFEFVAFDVLYRQAKLFFIAWAIKWAFLQKLALVEFQFRLNQVHHKHKLHLMEYHLRFHRPSTSLMDFQSVVWHVQYSLQMFILYSSFPFLFIHSIKFIFNNKNNKETKSTQICLHRQKFIEKINAKRNRKINCNFGVDVFLCSLNR